MLSEGLGYTPNRRAGDAIRVCVKPINEALKIDKTIHLFDYPVTLTPDDDTVLVTFADVPEAITFGANEAEALALAIDALETGLSFYVDARQPLPAVSRCTPGQKTVRPSALECAKLGAYQAMTEQGIR